MPERKVVIANEKGLHARASARFVKQVEHFEAEVTVRRTDGKGENGAVCGTSILDLLMLAADPGTELIISAKGREAAASLDALEALIQRDFDEV